jgi:hypothetical protein
VNLVQVPAADRSSTNLTHNLGTIDLHETAAKKIATKAATTTTEAAATETAITQPPSLPPIIEQVHRTNVELVYKQAFDHLHLISEEYNRYLINQEEITLERRQELQAKHATWNTIFLSASAVLQQNGPTPSFDMNKAHSELMETLRVLYSQQRR